MKISDLDEKQIVIGLRVGSLSERMGGTIVLVDHLDRYPYAWILWDKDLFNPITLIGGKTTSVHSGFFENQCEIPLLEDQTIPVLVQKFIDTCRKCKCKDCSK